MPSHGNSAQSEKVLQILPVIDLLSLAVNLQIPDSATSISLEVSRVAMKVVGKSVLFLRNM